MTGSSHRWSDCNSAWPGSAIGSGQSGVGAFYEELRAESAVLATVLSRPNGDRNLADLDHVADLLTAATARGEQRTGCACSISSTP